MTEIKAPQPKPRPEFFSAPCRAVRARVYDASGDLVATVAYRRSEDEETKAVRLIAAAPELLAACINARDMLATDRQAFVDCQQLRDSRTDDPIAHGLVAVEDGVWLDADDAEALRDYDRAIELIDKATAKATGAKA